MPEHYLRQSPLAHLHLGARATSDEAISNAGVIVRERPFLGMFNLRGDISEEPFQAAVKNAVGVALPTTANTCKGDPDGTRLLWLGPCEWLLVIVDVAATLQKATSAMTEVGEARTVIRIGGVNAREVLAKGCSLDLHPRAFAAGQCAQTQLARAAVILDHTRIDKMTGSAEFDLYVLRSFAEYLWTWVEDASQEYGIKVMT